ncbi:hypothetical protein [Streptomyces sp. NPDC050560]|uniref:hypothetical protein n=1 Tax=Streptomyces sp. NPDC050560 TaxID=3365630 RepID=UPI0037A9A9D0
MDGLGRDLDELRSRGGGEPEGSDGPVFVDESGRRGRHFRMVGAVVGLICAVYAVVIVATLVSGNSNAPWLPSLGPEAGKPAGSVDTSPVPSRTESAAPSGAGSASVTPSGTTGTAPSTGGESPSPDPTHSASGTPGGQSTKPDKPGGGKSDPADSPSHPGGGDSSGRPDSPGPDQSDEPGGGDTTPADPPASPPEGGEQPAGAREARVR